jgi:hypothetical protein
MAAHIVGHLSDGHPLTDGGPCWRPNCDGRIVVGRIMRWCQRCKTTGYA